MIVGNDEEFGFMAGGMDKGQAKARSLSESTAEIVIYKMGENGAVTYAGGDEIATGIYPVTAVKPNGAGDAFMAGLMTSLADGHDLRAAILRPQLRALADNAAGWNALYAVIEAGLAGTPGLTLINRPDAEAFVASSFQFLLLDWPDAAIIAVVESAKARGVELKWFGADRPQGFTPVDSHWDFAKPTPMPASDRVLKGVMDLRLPLTFTADDVALIARIIADEVTRAAPHLAAE